MSYARVHYGALGSVAYSVEGEGPCVVLLHPIGMDRSCWDAYVQHWRSRYCVISIDMLGHGASSPIRESISLAEHARYVLDIVRSQGAAPAVLVGVSMGGMVAQSVAIADPGSVRGLVLCATAGGFPASARAAIRARGDTSMPGSMSEVIAPTLERWFTPNSDPRIVEMCRERLAADDWHSWSANWEAISELDNLEALPRLTISALVVACEEDASIPVAVSRQLADALRAEFCLMVGSPHLGAFDAPGRFLAVIDPFLDALALPSA